MTPPANDPGQIKTRALNRRRIGKLRRVVGVALSMALLAATSAFAQSPADPGFWVTLPNGARVPVGHPLAVQAASAGKLAPSTPPASVPLAPTDPGFWVTLPNGARVPAGHPLAVQGHATARATAPAVSAPSSVPLGPTDPGFWVTLPNGARVPAGHPLAVQGHATAPAVSAPSSVPLGPTDPGFWVTLPNGARVPAGHPLAVQSQASPTPSAAPTPSPQPAPFTSDKPEPQPNPAPSSGESGKVKVLTWNIQHGVGTDGDYDIERIAAWIARTGANVVALNEVEKYTGWGNEDQPARFASLLRSRTGKTWRYEFAQRNGGSGTGQGNLLLTTFPIESADTYELSYSRSVAWIAIVVDGVRVNVFSTHLDAESSGRRATQMRELNSWAGTFAEQRIIVGDFNAWPGAWEISNMTSGYADAWAAARSDGTAVAFSGNSAGNTRNSRIDYVFVSKGASRLRLEQARVFDTRDSDGVRPSDHRPLMATLDIR